MPTIVPEIAYGLLWLWLLNPLYGPVNLLLGLGGEQERTFWGGARAAVVHRPRARAHGDSC